MSEQTFKNPDNLPIEELYLKLDSSNSASNGVIVTLKALDKYWASTRILSRFEPPPAKCNQLNIPIWKNKMGWYLDDLDLILSMKYHVFWSHIIYHKDCMDMLVSFLQEANPPYLDVYEDQSILEIYTNVYNKVMAVITRLTILKESQNEWMKQSYYSNIIYDKFIFTIPILFDICLLYGADNINNVKPIISSVIQTQPNYLKDLKAALLFAKQTFKFIAMQINPSENTAGDTILPDAFKGNPLTFRNANIKLTDDKKVAIAATSDFILYLLDTCLTLRIFLACFSEAASVFRELEYHLAIIQLYENALPDLYKNVMENDVCDVHSEPFKQLDIARMEMIDTVRLMLALSIESIASDSSEREKHVEIYLTMVMDCLSEKSFIRDYQMHHPIDVDLDLIEEACGEIDPVKTNFILQAVYSYLEDDHLTDKEAMTNTAAETRVNDYIIGQEPPSEIPEEIRTESLISEVKDIMPHLGDGYILKCLEFYSFNAERVINSILEGTLDKTLQQLDQSMPVIPVDPLDKQFMETGIDRLNVYDNDEFDVMTRDNIDSERVHKGKKKSKFKNLNDMLNDKSHVRELGDVYSKFSVVSDEEMYEDDYDDTLDNAGETTLRGRGRTVASVADDTDYTQRRAFVIPRVLRVQSESEEEEEEAQEPMGTTPQTSVPRDSFCVNPEEIRERRAAERGMGNRRGHRGTQPRNGDVIGRAKGQGQEKDVLVNRDKKTTNKSSRANHNRRAGAQWKRSRGFIPS